MCREYGIINFEIGNFETTSFEIATLISKFLFNFPTGTVLEVQSSTFMR